MENKFEKSIKKLKGYKNHNRWFLKEIIRDYSDFFKNIKISKIVEQGNDDACDCDMYYISIKCKVTDEIWEQFDKISTEYKIQNDGTDDELNIFIH